MDNFNKRPENKSFTGRPKFTNTNNAVNSSLNSEEIMRKSGGF